MSQIITPTIPIRIIEPHNLQDAVDMALTQQRIIEFSTNKTNAELRDILKKIDKKGCKFYKPDFFSDLVFVYTKELYEADI